jgi:hypothetical protein
VEEGGVAKFRVSSVVTAGATSSAGYGRAKEARPTEVCPAVARVVPVNHRCRKYSELPVNVQRVGRLSYLDAQYDIAARLESLS